jgi:hypothetical protein
MNDHGVPWMSEHGVKGNGCKEYLGWMSTKYLEWMHGVAGIGDHGMGRHGVFELG